MKSTAKFKVDMKAIGYGAASGAGMPYATQFLGRLGPPVLNGALGAWSGNETLQTIAGMQLGAMIPTMGGVAQVSGGGGWA